MVVAAIFSACFSIKARVQSRMYPAGAVGVLGLLGQAQGEGVEAQLGPDVALGLAARLELAFGDRRNFAAGAPGEGENAGLAPFRRVPAPAAEPVVLAHAVEVGLRA